MCLRTCLAALPHDGRGLLHRFPELFSGLFDILNRERPPCHIGEPSVRKRPGPSLRWIQGQPAGEYLEARPWSDHCLTTAEPGFTAALAARYAGTQPFYREVVPKGLVRRDRHLGRMITRPDRRAVRFGLLASCWIRKPVPDVRNGSLTCAREPVRAARQCFQFRSRPSSSTALGLPAGSFQFVDKL
jgi:hypothetical protein